MSSESLIQGLHEECRAAQAQAAAWEEIALAGPAIERGWRGDPDIGNGHEGHWVWGFFADPSDRTTWQEFKSKRAALLAWHASKIEQKERKEARSHRGISNGGDTCTDSYCWCANPLNREY